MIFVLLCGPSVLAQAIQGRVINSATKDPVPNAQLTLSCVKVLRRGGICRNANTKTSEDGTFLFDHLSAATYVLTAENGAGLVSTSASQYQFDFDYRHTLPSVLLKLEPESALSGRVVDLQNRPLADVEVVAWRQFATGSTTQLKTIAKTLSDGTGAYAFPHLIPGNYYVATTLVNTKGREQDGHAEVAGFRKAADSFSGTACALCAATSHAQDGHAEAAGTACALCAASQISKLRTRPPEQFLLYAPSALSLDEAVSTHLDMGQSYSGVDLHLRPILTHKIQGKSQTETSTQMPYDKLELHLDTRDSGGVTAPGRELLLEDDGSFQANVVPGDYILRLVGSTSVINPKAPKASPDTMLHLLARLDLEVSGKDLLSITILIPPPFTINGHISVEGQPDSKIEKGDITLRPIDAEAASGYQTAPVQPDGSFSLSNCDAAHYAVVYKPPAGLYIRSISFNGQDAMTHVMDFASTSGGELKIVMKTGAASVMASVQNATEPADVILIPDNWTPNGLVPVIHSVSKDGHFSALGIAPGHYSAIAVWGVARHLWDNAAFVNQMQARGTQFDLAESDQKQLSVPRLSEDDLNQIKLQLGLYY
jgi:hypothetical protein